MRFLGPDLSYLFSNPRLHYLSQVLGVQFLPQVLPTLPLKLELSLVTSVESSAARDELLNKMMAAIDCTRYQVFAPGAALESLMAAPMVLIFGPDILDESAKTNLAKTVRLFETSDLEEALNVAQPSKMVRAKKEIWQDLKKIRFFLQSSTTQPKGS